MVGGVRFEHNGSFGNYAAPRAAVSWLLDSKGSGAASTRLKASGGLGIKEPTLRQSYSPSPFDLGNPDLKPERSRGFDAGIEQRFARDRVRAEATFFSNHFDDLIGTGPSDPVTFASQYVNIGDTRARGWELSMDTAPAAGFAVHGYYVWQNSKVINSNNSFSPVYAAGRELLRRPRHSGSIQAEYSRHRVSVALGVLYVGKRVDSYFRSIGLESNDAYTTVNASGALKLARRSSGFINFENLGNLQYMDPLGYPGLGRTVRVGIRTGF
jgi:vitamin B12 transporter